MAGSSSSPASGNAPSSSASQRIAQLEQEVQFATSLLARNPNPVLRFDAQGKTIYRNPAASQLKQTLTLAEQHTACTMLQALVAESLAAGQPQERSLRVGSYEYTSCIVPTPAEQTVTFYLTDVTAHRRTEAQREAQRAFYEMVLDEIPVEVVVLDAERRYLYANPQAVPDPAHRAWLLGGHTVVEYCERYGFPLALSEHRHRMFAQAQASPEPVFWDDCTPLATGPVYHQRHFKRLSAGAGMGGGAYMLGCGLDVTARVLAEERSQRSEAARDEQQEFFQQVLTTSPNPVYVRNAAGEVVFGNRALFRLDEQSDYSTISEQLRLTKTQEAAQYAAVDAQVLATGQEVTSEDPFTLPSGERRWFYTIKRPLVRPDGTVQVLAVSTDITALKAAQLAAEAATTARENFLANMSHEIRTPMNGVLGMAALLAKTRLSDQQQEYLRAIRSSGTHLLGVLNDVLEVAKINSDKLELERIAFNLLDSIEQVVAPLAWQAQQKGLAFHFERIALACPWVLSDPFRLNQVLLNLLTNAIKFTDSGSVTLRGTLLAENDELLMIQFEVRDTGIGIGSEALARIFDSFTQAHADTTRRYGGTGLGLTISRALVRQMGGELLVASTPGEGSTFTFTLPLRKTAALASPAPEAFDTGQLRGTRMLLAEDNLINRTVARLHLLHWGVVVTEATDGPTALHLLEQHVYDAVLMDIQMPGLSGLEVTQRLRRHPDPARAATPVLALTANAFRTDTEKYLAAGFHDFLTKPFAEEQLYAKLAALLRQPAAPAPARPYDLTRLRHEARGHEAFVAGMVNSFLTHMPPTLHALRAASEAHDWLQVAELVHHIKPNLLTLAVESALAPMLTLEEPPLLLPTPDELVRQAAVLQLLAAVEKTLRELPTELAGD